MTLIRTSTRSSYLGILYKKLTLDPIDLNQETKLNEISTITEEAVTFPLVTIRILCVTVFTTNLLDI